MAEFFAMGGYAFFVCMSLGITAVVLVANLVWASMSHSQQLQRITRRVRRENLKT
jgi:heme exporter protein D